MSGLRKLVAVAIVGVIVAAFAGYYLVEAAAPHTSVSVGTTEPGSPTHFGHSAIGAHVVTGTASQTFLTCAFALTQCVYSANWGGYVVSNSSFLVTKVAGAWTVPTIAGATATTCPDAQTTWDSNAVWIGIDGANDGTVEQTGISADCYYGTPVYYPWYEFYPSASVGPAWAVNPGDKITATVTYQGTSGGNPTFQTVLKDTTTGNTLTSPVTAVPGALRTSAEWIDESPYYNGYLGLTDVSKITFTGASATINGHTHAISVSGWGKYNVYWWIVVDYDFPNTLSVANAKAEPSKLNGSGTSFSMTWESEGP